MANIGFNPMPNISLGDMENIFDIENEIALMSDEEPDITPKNKTVDKNSLIQQFMLTEAVPKKVSQPIQSVKTQQVKTSKPTELKYEVQEIDDDDIKQHDEEEQKLLERIKKAEEVKKAEEAKKAEEERREKLRKLEEEALQAEKEAELARKKREAEQRRIDEERKLQQMRLEEQARKEEAERIESERKFKAEQERIKREQEQIRLLEQQRIEAENRRKQLEEENKRRQKEEENKRKQQEEKERQERLRKVLEIKKMKQAQEQAAKTNAVKNKQTAHKDAVDNLNKNIKSAPIQNGSLYDKYNSLDTDALYDEVRKFMNTHNVGKRIVDVKILENEFGKANIKKLILKSYLISVGKGVTIGK